MICFLFLVIFGQIKPILHFGKFPFGLIHQKSTTVYECLSKIWGAFLGDQPKWKTSTPVLQSMAQLRPTMGNHLTTNWSWKFTTRPCWCFWSYSPRTFEAQHQGLDWAQYKGLCAQIGLHPWLAKPPPIPWDQAGGRSVERWRGEPFVPQHETPRLEHDQSSTCSQVDQTNTQSYPSRSHHDHTNLIIKLVVPYKSNSLQAIFLLWFRLAAPEDVPAALQRAINSGSSTARASENDVILFVKKYISDVELAQEPLLVMTETRAAGFNLIPNTKTLSLFLV